MSQYNPQYKRIATEEAWVTKDILQRYVELIKDGNHNDPGFGNFWGFVAASADQRARELTNRLQDIDAQRLAHMDAAGIDLAILSMTCPGVQLFEANTAVALARDSNDELAQAILLSPDADYIEQVQAAMNRLLPTLPRAPIIAASLAGRGALIHTRSMEEACTLANRIAPEHLELASRTPRRWEPLLRHAGAIFLGAYTSESLGDYCAGPNHVLPTSGTARFSSPLSVYDFQKRSSLIEVSEAGAQQIGRIASVLAHGEGLQAHARAAELRLKP